MKKILSIIFWLILIAGIVWAAGHINRRHDNQTFKAIKISIQPETDDRFVTEEDILQMINEKYDSLVGKSLDVIHIDELEDMITGNQYVKQSDVHITLNGTLIINVILREPIVRVINSNGKQRYIDNDGFIMETHPSRASHVMLASGWIDDPLENKQVMPDRMKADDSKLPEILSLAAYIHKHEFYHALIEQIYYDKSGEINLVPKIGDQVIIVGSSAEFESKMDKLFAFYRKGLRNMDWSCYKKINLKYKNQVVCSK